MSTDKANSLIENNWLAIVNNGQYINDGTVNWFNQLEGWEFVTPVDRGQVPYTFEHVPHAIPGKIQGENFDVGGEGVAYSDVDAGNNGTAFGLTCRSNENVDVGPVGDGNCSIGWTAEGEWLEYTVDVAGEGENGTDPITMNVIIAMALPDDGASINVLVDGVDLLGDVPVPNTGAWDAFQPIEIEGVVIQPGSHVIRVEFTQGGNTFGSPGSFDFIEFKDPNASQPYHLDYVLPIPGVIQVEEFNRGKQGSAFVDLSAPQFTGITAPCSRDDVDPADAATFPVAIAPHYDQCSVNSTGTGEWLEYTVQVAQSGTYDLVVTAVHGGGRTEIPSFQVSVDSANVTGVIETPWDAAWLLQDVVIKDIALTAGEHNIRLEFQGVSEGHSGVFDKIEFIRSTPADNTGQVAYQDNTIATSSATMLQAAFFDLGGEEVAWSDTSDIFHNGANSDCRTETGVDGNIDVNWLTIDFDGYLNCSLGSFFAGEWVEYTLELDTETTFDVSLLNDTGILGSYAILDINGQNLSEVPFVSSSTNWGSYTTDTVSNITLPAGESVLRLTVGFGGMNVHQITFTPVP